MTQPPTELPEAPPAPVGPASVLSPKDDRPDLIVLLPVLALLVLVGAIMLRDAGISTGGRGDPWLAPLILGILSLITAPLLIVAGRFGWILAVWGVGWSLLYLIVRWASDDEPYLAMLCAAALAFLLLTPEMRTSYRDREFDRP
jgi:hypothetical protein